MEINLIFLGASYSPLFKQISRRARITRPTEFLIESIFGENRKRAVIWRLKITPGNRFFYATNYFSRLNKERGDAEKPNVSPISDLIRRNSLR